jgi:ribonuclease HII
MCASSCAVVSPSANPTLRRAARASNSTPRVTAGLALEAELWSDGYRAIAGVDEVGRGPWAGPVVAAAVILRPDPDALAPLLGQVDDSKRLAPRQRERLFGPIQQLALATGVGRVEASAIDRVGIAAATRQAMRQALAALAVQPDFVLLDYLTLPDLPLPQRGVPHGDALSLSIAAASIIAKVTRDRWMTEQEAIYPGYGFARHKGYGTTGHHAALVRLGPCALHRLSFAPVAAMRARSDQEADFQAGSNAN